MRTPEDGLVENEEDVTTSGRAIAQTRSLSFLSRSVALGMYSKPRSVAIPHDQYDKNPFRTTSQSEAARLPPCREGIKDLEKAESNEKEDRKVVVFLIVINLVSQL